MAWSATHVFTTGEVVTAAVMNVISNDLDALNTKISNTATVGTSQTTTSTTYTDLATTGPTVSSLTTGTFALVAVQAQMSSNTANAFEAMSFAVSGATTVAAADSTAAIFSHATATGVGRVGVTVPVTLTAGSNTFTSKYRVNAGTGTFLDRTIVVIPQF